MREQLLIEVYDEVRRISTGLTFISARLIAFLVRKDLIQYQKLRYILLPPLLTQIAP